MISIFVTIKVKDGYADQFTEASFGDSQGSVRDETGCYRFDISLVLVTQNFKEPKRQSNKADLVVWFCVHGFADGN